MTQPPTQPRDRLRTVTVDLAGVPLVADDYGVHVPLRDGTAAAHYDDLVRVHLAVEPVNYPVTIDGDLSAPLTLDEAVNLAYALLALVREADRGALTRAFRDHNTGDLARRVTAELEVDL